MQGTSEFQIGCPGPRKQIPACSSQHNNFKEHLCGIVWSEMMQYPSINPTHRRCPYSNEDFRSTGGHAHFDDGIVHDTLYIIFSEHKWGRHIKHTEQYRHSHNHQRERGGKAHKKSKAHESFYSLTQMSARHDAINFIDARGYHPTIIRRASIPAGWLNQWTLSLAWPLNPEEHDSPDSIRGD